MDPYSTPVVSPLAAPLAAVPESSSRQAPVSLQVRMVVLSYLAYFFYYFTRKHLGVATAALVRDGYSVETIAWAQTAYNICYAVGQLVSGALGDRLGPRIALFLGMVLSAIASIAFGVFPFMALLVVATSLNGLFQATGWSNTCKVISSWINYSKRGRVMGAWMTCYILGSMAATAAAGFLLQHYGWREMFMVLGGAVMLIGIAQGLFLINRPEDRGYTVERHEPAKTDGPARKDGFMKMIRHPMVLLLGLSYTGMKFVRYTFFTWLPYYLATVIHLPDSTSAYVSVSFEVGGVVGLVIGGILADKWFQQNRSRLAFLALVMMALSLLAYRNVSATGGIGVNFATLAAIGFSLYIADSIVSGSAAQDIGGVGSTASATGIVNGIGSVGQIFAGILPIWMRDRWGWDAVFLSFIAVAVFSCLAIIPVARRRELVQA